MAKDEEVTDTLTADERESLVTCYDPDESVIKLLRLYDAALARAESAVSVAEHEKVQADAHECALNAIACSKLAIAAESRLAEATALLKDWHKYVRNSHPLIWSNTDAFLSGSTPAPAADEGYVENFGTEQALYVPPAPAAESRPTHETPTGPHQNPSWCQVCQREREQLMVRNRALESRIAELEAQRDALLDTKATYQIAVAQAVAELEKARAMSGNRWSEWGSRAESVGELMDGALELLRGNRT